MALARHLRRAAVAFPALCLGACYSYRVAAAPAPGADVRVELTAEGAATLVRYLGPRVSTVDGRLNGYGPDSALLVAVSSVRGADGGSTPWAGEAPVEIARGHVAWLGLRTLDRRRSWLAGAVTAAALGAIGAVAVDASRGKSGEPGNPPPPPPP